MEKAIVSIKNDIKEISIKFEYNAKTEELDYDFINVPEIKPDEEPDLITVLATHLLNALVQKPSE